MTVVFLSSLFRALIGEFIWDKITKHYAQKETPMKLHNGVYVPWGPIDKIRYIGDKLISIYAAYLIALVVSLIII